MFAKFKHYIVHKHAVFILDRALTQNLADDFNANDVINRLIILGKFDSKHHNVLNINQQQVRYLAVLGKSTGTPAQRRAELILFEAVRHFKKSYHIDVGCTELHPLAYHYLAQLSINLLPVDPKTKMLFNLANDLI